MAKEQGSLPFGAAQGNYDERRLKVGMTIGAMYDPETEQVRETYTGAPVMELRVLMLLMLDEEARGRFLTPEEMIKPPWGLLCSERTVRRLIKWGLDLGILQDDRRLETNQQKFTKVWRLNWAGIHRFICSQPPGHGGKTTGQADHSPGHGGNSSGQDGQARTCSSSSFLNELDVVDDVLGKELRTDWPKGQVRTTGHGASTGEPESANDPPHDGPRSSGRVVSGTPRRAAATDVTALVGLVRQCGVFAAERAVQVAIGHGHDIPAQIAGWRRYCRPGCDPEFAAKRLFYRLVDPPMGLEPHQGWIVQHPQRVRPAEADERDAIKRKREAEQAEQAALEQRQRAAAKAWILSIAEPEQLEILEEYRSEVSELERTGSLKAKAPLEQGFFLKWLVKRNGGNDGGEV